MILNRPTVDNLPAPTIGWLSHLWSYLNGLQVKGTWTPVVTFSTPGDLSVAYTTQVGFYIREHDLVCVTFGIQTSSFTHTTASGALQITGLPFTVANKTNYFPIGSLSWAGITKANYTDIIPFITSNTTTMGFVASGSGQIRHTITSASVPTAGQVDLFGTIVYEI